MDRSDFYHFWLWIINTTKETFHSLFFPYLYSANAQDRLRSCVLRWQRRQNPSPPTFKWPYVIESRINRQSFVHTPWSCRQFWYLSVGTNVRNASRSSHWLIPLQDHFLRVKNWRGALFSALHVSSHLISSNALFSENIIKILIQEDLVRSLGKRKSWVREGSQETLEAMGKNHTLLLWYMIDFPILGWDGTWEAAFPR